MKTVGIRRTTRLTGVSRDFEQEGDRDFHGDTGCGLLMPGRFGLGK
jgi:hypothetical protein